MAWCGLTGPGRGQPPTPGSRSPLHWTRWDSHWHIVGTQFRSVSMPESGKPPEGAIRTPAVGQA